MLKTYSGAEEEYNRRKEQRQQRSACRNRNQVNARSPKSLEADKSSPNEDTDCPTRDDQKERHTGKSISCRILRLDYPRGGEMEF